MREIMENKNTTPIREIASKYGEEVNCLFLDYDNEWKQKTMVVSASFLKDMEQGAIVVINTEEEIEYCNKYKWGDCECKGDCRRGLTK